MDSAAEDTFGEEEDDMQRCAMHYTSSDGTRRTLHYRAKEEVRLFFLFAVRRPPASRSASHHGRRRHLPKYARTKVDSRRARGCTFAISPRTPSRHPRPPAAFPCLPFPLVQSMACVCECQMHRRCTWPAHELLFASVANRISALAMCALGTDARRRFGDRCVFTSRCFDENSSRFGGVAGFCELIDSHCFGETLVWLTAVVGAQFGHFGKRRMH